MRNKYYESLSKRIAKLEHILLENVKVSDLFHVSKVRITTLNTTPMYFALSKHDSLGWYEIIKDENYGVALMYKATVRQSAVILTSDEFAKELNISKHDADEYLYMLLANPTSREILSDKITQLAMDSGIDGIKYSDVNPNNLDEDADAILIFNPKKSIQTFSLEYIGENDSDGVESFTDMKDHMYDLCTSLFNSKKDDFNVSGYYGGKESCNIDIGDNLDKYAPKSFSGRVIQAHVIYEDSTVEIFAVGVGIVKRSVDILKLNPQSFVKLINSMISSKI